MKIVAKCDNKNRSTMKCQRICCRRSKPEIKDETVQMILWNTRRGFGPKPYLHRKPSSKK